MTPQNKKTSKKELKGKKLGKVSGGISIDFWGAGPRKVEAKLKREWRKSGGEQ